MICERQIRLAENAGLQFQNRSRLINSGDKGGFVEPELKMQSGY
jgi:hypothetical protein